MDEQLLKALESVEKALDLMAPPNEWYFFQAGKIHELLVENDLALDAYQHAVLINPDNESAQKGVNRLSNP